MFKDVIYKGHETYLMINEKGEVYDKRLERLRKPYRDKKGYLRVQVFTTDGFHFGAFVHRLVATTFIPNDDPIHKDQIDHINCIKTDNRVENLEWVTCKENIRRSYVNGLAKHNKGEAHHMAKITEEQATMICKLLSKGDMSTSEIADLVGTSKDTVQHISAGKTWTHISKNYTFPQRFFNDFSKINAAIDLLLYEGYSVDEMTEPLMEKFGYPRLKTRRLIATRAFMYRKYHKDKWQHVLSAREKGAKINIEDFMKGLSEE